MGCDCDKKPIMEFDNEEQLYAALSYWQKVLFLDDWIFKVSLVEPESLSDKGEEFSGQISITFTLKCASIRIEKLTDDTRKRILKVCQEQTLIHELLHCKYNWLVAKDTYEGNYTDEIEHQLLEQMSKTLIMVRYKLPFEWFKNF